MWSVLCTLIVYTYHSVIYLKSEHLILYFSVDPQTKTNLWVQHNSWQWRLIYLRHCCEIIYLFFFFFLQCLMFYSQKKANGAPNGFYGEIDWDRYVSKSLRMLIIHTVFIVPVNIMPHLFVCLITDLSWCGWWRFQR